MRTCITIFFISFIITYFLTPVLIRLCMRWGILDIPHGPRSVHEEPVPTMGGVAVYISFFLPFLLLVFYNNTISRTFLLNREILIGLFVSGSIVFGIGVYDDIKGMRPFMKLLFQCLAAVIIYCFGFKIAVVSNPFGQPFELGIYSLPFTILWIVGVTNAINLIDGIDGLAAGVTFFTSIAILFIAIGMGNIYTIAFVSALAGGMLGVLKYNFPPAKIFLGDSGSMFLGFVLGAIAIRGSQKGATAVALLIPIIVLGLPLIDTILAMARRLLRGVPISAGDRQHIHHILVKSGFTKRQVAFLLYGLCVLFGMVALLVMVMKNQFAAGVLGVMFLIAMVSYWVQRLGYFDIVRVQQGIKETVQKRKENRYLLSLINVFDFEKGDSHSLNELWEQTETLCKKMGFSSASMSLETKPRQGHSGATKMFSWGEVNGKDEVIQVFLTPKYNNGISGKLLLQRDSNKHPGKDTEIDYVIEQLALHVADAVEKIADK